MDEVRQYKTAGGFRAALETRLQKRAHEEATDLQRLRRQVAFDRLLARLFPKGPKGTYPWMLKGGYVMELRIRSARTTKDIDLTLHDGTRLSKDPGERRQQVRGMLQDAASIQLHDYFEFLIGEAREDMDGAPEGGSRYSVEARMDGREFARFHVDIGIGDEVLEPLDEVKARDWLGFGGIAPPSLPVISGEQQFAEKLHAYSLARLDRVKSCCYGTVHTCEGIPYPPPWVWLAGSYPHPTGNDEQPESFTPYPDLHFDRVSADRIRFVNYWYRNYQFITITGATS
jgi:hypothetical protein